MPAMGDLGTFVRTHRKALGLTLEETGRAAGVTPQSISDLELGKTKTLKASTAFRLARILQLSKDEVAEFERLLEPVPA